MHFSFVKIINTRVINFELILNLSEFLNKYIIYTPSSLIKRYIHTNIHTYIRTSIFPLLLSHKRLSFSKSIEIDARFYRSVLHPESPRRSNLVDASLESISEAHAADRSIPKNFSSARISTFTNLYATNWRERRISIEGRFVEFSCRDGTTFLETRRDSRFQWWGEGW